MSEYSRISYILTYKTYDRGVIDYDLIKYRLLEFYAPTVCFFKEAIVESMAVFGNPTISYTKQVDPLYVYKISFTVSLHIDKKVMNREKLRLSPDDFLVAESDIAVYEQWNPAIVICAF